MNSCTSSLILSVAVTLASTAVLSAPAAVPGFLTPGLLGGVAYRSSTTPLTEMHCHVLPDRVIRTRKFQAAPTASTETEYTTLGSELVSLGSQLATKNLVTEEFPIPATQDTAYFVQTGFSTTIVARDGDLRMRNLSASADFIINLLDWVCETPGQAPVVLPPPVFAKGVLPDDLPTRFLGHGGYSTVFNWDDYLASIEDCDQNVPATCTNSENIRCVMAEPPTCTMRAGVTVAIPGAPQNRNDPRRPQPSNVLNPNILGGVSPVLQPEIPPRDPASGAQNDALADPSADIAEQAAWVYPIPEHIGFNDIDHLPPPGLSPAGQFVACKKTAPVPAGLDPSQMTVPPNRLALYQNAPRLVHAGNGLTKNVPLNLYSEETGDPVIARPESHPWIYNQKTFRPEADSTFTDGDLQQLVDNLSERERALYQIFQKGAAQYVAYQFSGKIMSPSFDQDSYRCYQHLYALPVIFKPVGPVMGFLDRVQEWWDGEVRSDLEITAVNPSDMVLAITYVRLPFGLKLAKEINRFQKLLIPPRGQVKIPLTLSGALQSEPSEIAITLSGLEGSPLRLSVFHSGQRVTAYPGIELVVGGTP